MTRLQRLRLVIGVVLALVAPGACGDGSGPDEITLDDLSSPDTNTAVLAVDRDVIEGSDTVKAGVEEVYLIQTGLAPEILSADRGVKRVLVRVADGFVTGRYLTDGEEFDFRWTGPTGREYYPALKCALTIDSAFVPDTPSTMLLETACLVAPLTGGASFTVLVKARRFGTIETGP